MSWAAVDPFTASRRLLYADYTVLNSAPDGTISHDPEGLYDHDTRILSCYRLSIDGQKLKFVSSADLAAHRRLTVLLAPRTGGNATGPVLPQDVLEVPAQQRPRSQPARPRPSLRHDGFIVWPAER